MMDEQKPDMSQVSDGYHTFAELYEHRLVLTALVVEGFPETMKWRSKAHHPDDEPIYDGYFIVGINMGAIGMITYHYPLEEWDLFKGAQEFPYAPKWDGSTPKDAVDRIRLWLSL